MNQPDLLRKPVILVVTKKGGVYIARNNKLGLVITVKSLENMGQQFYYAINTLITGIIFEDPDKLSEKERKVKKQLIEVLLPELINKR